MPERGITKASYAAAVLRGVATAEARLRGRAAAADGRPASPPAAGGAESGSSSRSGSSGSGSGSGGSRDAGEGAGGGGAGSAEEEAFLQPPMLVRLILSIDRREGPEAATETVGWRGGGASVPARPSDGQDPGGMEGEQKGRAEPSSRARGKCSTQ